MVDWSVIDSFVLEKISETKIPGLSLAVIENNEITYARGYGYRDLSKLDAMNPGTLMGIGSVTKSFTALAILKLVEDGKLSLNDPVDKYVPLRIKSHESPITIHHLLTHSSGIPALGYAEAFIRSVLGVRGSWTNLPNSPFLGHITLHPLWGHRGHVIGLAPCWATPPPPSKPC